MPMRLKQGALMALFLCLPLGAFAQDAADSGAQAPVQPQTPAPATTPSLPANPPPIPAPPAEAQAAPAQAPSADAPPNAPQAYAAPAPAAVQVQYATPSGPSMAPPGPAAQGQWVFTTQYGWIWTPYAQNYTYVDQIGEMALTYAFYPSYGWRWLPSPWVLGFGPAPYWGIYGYDHYAWHARPWFSAGIYRPAIWQRWGRPYGGYGYNQGAAYGRPYGGYNGAYGGRPGPIISGPRPSPVYSHPTYSQPSYAPHQSVPAHFNAPAQFNRGPAPNHAGGMGGGHFGHGGGGGGGGGHHR